MFLVSVLFRFTGWVLIGFAAVGVLVSSLPTLTAAMGVFCGWMLVSLGREAASAREAARRDRQVAEERAIESWRQTRD